MSKTQKDMVLNWLQRGNSITGIEAWQLFSCYRLSDVIYKLRNEGYAIITDIVEDRNGRMFASYRMAKETKE